MKNKIYDIPKAARYLAFRIPTIKTEILKLSAMRNFAAILQSIINYQHEILSGHKVEQLKVSIQAIGRIYVKGNTHIRYLIRNLYLRAQAFYADRCTNTEWILIQSYVPQKIKLISINLNK
ncbi:DUF7674 family protein [Rhizosphaericola mali]|uniref:DUF7674 domain-containing protein n=1 Tax=Rhizosphaericola mali TaxID=2545455 RepID=A0A5P2G3I4_9BACT|nr:hypothetical protein [Rhizosphaericola mali]QES88370.1 hypothetical protein E0W69_006755 [Rhizosphaericola mali]